MLICRTIQHIHCSLAHHECFSNTLIVHLPSIFVSHWFKAGESKNITPTSFFLPCSHNGSNVKSPLNCSIFGRDKRGLISGLPCSYFQPKTGFWPFLGPSSSCRSEKKHSIGKIKFCIGLSLIIKLLVGKRV